MTTLMEQYLIRQAAQNNIDRYTQTRGRYGAAMLGMDMANAGIGPVTPEALVPLMVNATNQPKVAAIKDAGVTVYSSRQTVPFTTAEGETAFVVLTRYVAESIFRLTPAEYKGNAVSEMGSFDRKVSEAIRKILNAIDVTAVAGLAAARSQVGSSSLPLTFDDTNDRYTITAGAGIDNEAKTRLGALLVESTAQPFVAQGFDAEMAHLIGSPALASVYRYMQRFGANNAEDWKQALTAGKAMPYMSTNIVEGTGTPAELLNMYALLPYSFGVYTGTESDADAGLILDTGRTYNTFLPELGANASIFETGSFKDLSARGLSERQGVKEFAITVPYTVVTAYQPDIATLATPIAKFTLLDNA